MVYHIINDENCRYSDDFCDTSIMKKSNVCSKGDLLFEKVDDYGWLIQNEEFSHENCAINATIFNNLTVKLGIENLDGFQLKINGQDIQSNISILESDFVLELAKIPNVETNKFKAHYIVYDDLA